MGADLLLPRAQAQRYPNSKDAECGQWGDNPIPGRGLERCIPIGAKSRLLLSSPPSPQEQAAPAGRSPRRRAGLQLGGGEGSACFPRAGCVPKPGGSSRSANPRPSQGRAGAGTFCPCQRRGRPRASRVTSLLHGRADPPHQSADPPPEDSSLQARLWLSILQLDPRDGSLIFFLGWGG